MQRVELNIKNNVPGSGKSNRSQLGVLVDYPTAYYNICDRFRARVFIPNLIAHLFLPPGLLPYNLVIQRAYKFTYFISKYSNTLERERNLLESTVYEIILYPSGGVSRSLITTISSTTQPGGPSVFEKQMYLPFFLINSPLSLHRSASVSWS